MPACVAKQPNVMFDPHLQIIQGRSVNIIRWPQKDAIFRPFTVPYAIFYLFPVLRIRIRFILDFRIRVRIRPYKN